ncbi:uncharacterized protein LOC116416236 [Nasonia vitripennis]|uniref:CCHC-type domain-containing protein n=1 Tax=Nasonia vitripennis TaxID=7425 RepID=A0A7M7Q3P0_NASVI|nr:uncharacterized protein LOC116416236 [Nasonia vitripennis]
MKPVKRKSPGELIELLDKAEAAHKTFKDAGCPCEHWDSWLIHMVERKLDNETREGWRCRWCNASVKCSLCKGPHQLQACPRFNGMSTSAHFEHCKKERLCLNCLRSGHLSADCISQNRCANCKGRHNTKVHSDQRQGGEAADSSNSTGQKGSSSAPGKSSMLEVSGSTIVVGWTRLMATAKVLIQSVQSLLIRKEWCNVCPQRLSLFLSLWLVTVQVLLRCSTVKSRLNSEFCLEFSALVLREVTGFFPREEVVVSNWDHIRGLQLADPDFARSKRIDCVLSAEVYAAIIRPGLIIGATDTPVAQETVFGWILTGRASSSAESDGAQTAHACHVEVEPSVSSLSERFWEEISTSQVLSKEDQYCEDYFLDTVYRDYKGRFVVRLPFSERLSEVSFAHTRQIAVACWLRSEKRRAQDSRVDSAYRKFMEEYLNLGHMELVNSSHRRDNTFYFTHQPVYSAESDVTIIISMWRFSEVVFTADIVKEFRQILIHPDDVDWQRIVWRSDVLKPIEDYRLLTVTYGTRSAPYLSIRTLLQLASEGSVEFPLAAQVLRHNMYVDDAFVCSDNESEAIEIRNQLIKLLSSAGMELGKWASNSSAIVEDIQTEKQKEFVVEWDEAVSALGLKWTPSSDSFRFEVKIPVSPKVVSKRAILSEISRLFDPLSWLSPVLVRAKLMLQDLWINGVDWDSPLTGEHLDQ